MSTPEGKVKEWVDKLMKEWFPGCWRYCPPGGRFGKNGEPDRLYLWSGIFIAIETKVPGNPATPLQLLRLRTIAANGGVAAVVSGKDLDKMMRIRNEVIRRLQLAYEARKDTVPASEGNSGVSTPE
jgi:hypothetical protein